MMGLSGNEASASGGRAVGASQAPERVPFGARAAASAGTERNRPLNFRASRRARADVSDQ
jgi:hypothetical protein